jgi:hypothetical protein
MKPSFRERTKKREDFGWHVIVVPGDERRPSTAYSIGLFKNFGHPEIVIFGTDQAVLRGSSTVSARR